MKKKRIEKIEFIETDYLISQDVFKGWRETLALANTFKKASLLNFLQAVLSLAKEDAKVDRLLVKIDREVLTPEVLKKYDVKKAVDDLRNNMIPVGVENESYVNSANVEHLEDMKSILKSSSLLDKYILALKNIAEKAEKVTNKTIYYGVLPVDKNVLFVHCADTYGEEYFRFRPIFLPFLKYIDLSSISFERVDIRGLDLSLTNGSIDINLVYRKSAENTNLKDALLADNVIDGCNLKGANISGTGAKINERTCFLGNTTIDESVSFVDMGGNPIPISNDRKIDLKKLDQN